VTNSFRSTGERVRVALAVLALAAVGLAYEVTLTRLFSLIFQYHYVFLIVSLAVLGLGVGAAIGHLTRARARHAALGAAALALGAALIGVALALSAMRSADRVALAAGLGLVPFVILGWLNATLFARYAAHSALLYGADLLGAALGLGAALLLVEQAGALGSVLALAAVAGLAAALLAWESRRALAGGAGLLVALGVGLAAAGEVDYDPARLRDAPPDKTMTHVLQDPAAGAEVLDTRWSAFARVDLVRIADEALRYVFTDAGAGSVMVRYDPAAPQEASWLEANADNLPFAIEPPPDRVLILGAGAGKDVIQARLAGAQSITAVEINPTMVELTNDYAGYTGDVFHLPGVTTVVTDGRNYVERSDGQYDLIYLNLVYSQAATPGAAALAENYVFTREALGAYWDHLSDEGRIGAVTHNGPEGIRLFLGALDLLQREGFSLREALDRVTLTTRRTTDPQARQTIVTIDRAPWTEARVQALRALIEARGMSILYLPHINEQLLGGLATGELTLDEYIAGNEEFNYFPTTDDRPFFYHLQPGLPDALRTLLRAVLVLALLYLALVVVTWDPRQVALGRRAAWLGYFALLGAGFMLVEIPLIQRFNLLLGAPALALIAVIGGMLLGASAGSLFSGRFGLARLPRLVTFAALATGLGVLAGTVLYPALIDLTLPAPLAARVGVTVLLLAPLGFVMGMAFPSGLRLASVADPGGIPAHWGANAVASTLGSALATALAMSYGFNTALLLGAALYLAVALYTWGLIGRRYAVS